MILAPITAGEGLFLRGTATIPPKKYREEWMGKRMEIATLLTLDQIENVCSTVGTKLQPEHLDRTGLTNLETALTTVSSDLTEVVTESTRKFGRTPDTVLAQLAVQAMNDALDWIRLYRRHATVVERRERLEAARSGAMGAIVHLRRLEATEDMGPR